MLINLMQIIKIIMLTMNSSLTIIMDNNRIRAQAQETEVRAREIVTLSW
jgi:hypothetical protein